MEDIIIIRLKRDFSLVFKHIKETLKRYKNISYRLVTIDGFRYRLSSDLDKCGRSYSHVTPSMFLNNSMELKGVLPKFFLLFMCRAFSFI